MENYTDSTSGSGKHQFILFVSGMSVKSGHAIENFKKICDEHLNNNFEVRIIDLSRDKEYAISHQIVAVPTLIRTYPDPPRIIVGDLSDTLKVLKILNIAQ